MTIHVFILRQWLSSIHSFHTSPAGHFDKDDFYSLFQCGLLAVFVVSRPAQIFELSDSECCYAASLYDTWHEQNINTHSTDTDQKIFNADLSDFTIILGMRDTTYSLIFQAALWLVTRWRYFVKLLSSLSESDFRFAWLYGWNCQMETVICHPPLIVGIIHGCLPLTNLDMIVSLLSRTVL